MAVMTPYFHVEECINDLEIVCSAATLQDILNNTIYLPL